MAIGEGDSLVDLHANDLRVQGGGVGDERADSGNEGSDWGGG